MLEMKHIYKYYNPGTVNEMCLFQDLNLTVEDGEFVAIVGSNGSGKTSLLNLICGSIPVDSGSITINGENITGQKEYRRMSKIGRVFQNPAMGTCPSMTILENLALADNKGKRYGLGLGVQKKREEHYKEMLRPLRRDGVPGPEPGVADALLPVARIAGYVQRDHAAVSAVFRVRLRYGAFGALPVQVYYPRIVHILTSCSVIRPLSPI